MSENTEIRSALELLTAEQTVENRVDGAGRDVIARHDRQGRKGIAHLDSPSNYSNIVQTTALKRLKASFRVLFGG